MSWHSFKRRLRRSGLSQTFAYSWNEFQTNPKLHSKYNKNNLYIRCPCGKDYVCIVFGFVNRKYQVPVCDECYKTQYSYDEEWRQNNSKAQLIAQNNPKTIAKQRASQKKRHAQPGMKEKYRKIGLKLWEDKNYRKKVIKNSSITMSGIYKKIEYQSSYELAFIMWNLEQGNDIKRFDLEGIPYLWEGKEHRYYSDFIVNENKIVEDKGKGSIYNKHKELCATKNKALKVWCRSNSFYDRLVFDTDLSKDLIKKARKWHKENSIGKIS